MQFYKRGKTKHAMQWEEELTALERTLLDCVSSGLTFETKVTNNRDKTLFRKLRGRMSTSHHVLGCAIFTN